MIKLINLTKDFKTTLAVNRLNLEVAAGEIYGFIGPNGAGKTTTIRMMGGIIEPTDGKILIGEIDVSRDPVGAKKIIGFVPDRPFLYEKLTGMEFMKFIADLYRVDLRAFSRRSLELLEQFALLEWKDEIIEAYSHGMKQRLVISAALLHDPRVIVVDEPMVGLDPAAIKMVKDILKDLARRGTAVFMSTHTLSVAEDLCDRIGIIHRGALIALGTTRELKRMAQAQQADLEEIFLKLTEEQALS